MQLVIGKVGFWITVSYPNIPALLLTHYIVMLSSLLSKCSLLHWVKRKKWLLGAILVLWGQSLRFLYIVKALHRDLKELIIGEETSPNQSTSTQNRKTKNKQTNKNMKIKFLKSNSDNSQFWSKITVTVLVWKKNNTKNPSGWSFAHHLITSRKSKSRVFFQAKTIG